MRWTAALCASFVLVACQGGGSPSEPPPLASHAVTENWTLALQTPAGAACGTAGTESMPMWVEHNGSLVHFLYHLQNYPTDNDQFDGTVTGLAFTAVEELSAGQATATGQFSADGSSLSAVETDDYGGGAVCRRSWTAVRQAG